MPPRIAIPMPHSIDLEYGERAIPQYERAVAIVGGEPVRIPLDPKASLERLIESCDAVLLPGSNADVDPAKFRRLRSERTAQSDARREEVDFLLLDDAFARRKPVLGICYGLQSLNVYLGGSLIQHIPDFLPEATRGKVNHEAGKKVAIAHAVELAQDSKLFGIVNSRAANDKIQTGLLVPVNSSHHQSADAIGDGLCIVARCPDDEVVEAVEGTTPDHFVLAVQWHPERSVDEDAASRNIFRALVEAAKKKS